MGYPRFLSMAGAGIVSAILGTFTWLLFLGLRSFRGILRPTVDRERYMCCFGPCDLTTSVRRPLCPDQEPSAKADTGETGAAYTGKYFHSYPVGAPLSPWEHPCYASAWRHRASEHIPSPQSFLWVGERIDIFHTDTLSFQ